MTVSGSGWKSVFSSPRSCSAEQVLADVVDALGDGAQRRVVAELEDLDRLALEHQRAARRRADDVDARAGGRAPAARRAGARRSARRRTGRWTAAAGRSSPAWARRPRCRCARAARPSSRPGAARSSSCRSRGRRPRGAPRTASCACAPSAGRCGPAKRGIGASRWIPIVCSAASRSSAVAQRPVRDRRRRACPRRPASVGRASSRSRSGTPFVRLERRPRLRVDLGDVDALRADLRADAAARAVVQRRVGRRLVADAEALGLRPDVLRPREQRRDVGDRAERLADRALDAVVERLAHQQRPEHVSLARRHGDQLLVAAAGAAVVDVAASTSSAAR